MDPQSLWCTHTSNSWQHPVLTSCSLTGCQRVDWLNRQSIDKVFNSYWSRGSSKCRSGWVWCKVRSGCQSEQVSAECRFRSCVLLITFAEDWLLVGRKNGDLKTKNPWNPVRVVVNQGQKLTLILVLYLSISMSIIWTKIMHTPNLQIFAQAVPYPHPYLLHAPLEMVPMVQLGMNTLQTVGMNTSR